MGLLLLAVTCLCLTLVQSSALLDGEERAIEICLRNYGGLKSANLDRLERYTHWSEKREEIPCFTQCYLKEMYEFYDIETGFDEPRIKRYFGEAVYDACKDRLQLGWGQEKSSCEHAYAGFHCIVSLENDPFILIENMSNVTRSAKSAMKECLQEVEQVEWNRIADYAKFPVVEPIPCFTRCFITKLQLYDERTRRWRLPAMRQTLSVPAAGVRVQHCQHRRGRNPCATFHEQFTCYAKAD